MATEVLTLSGGSAMEYSRLSWLRLAISKTHSCSSMGHRRTLLPHVVCMLYTGLQLTLPADVTRQRSVSKSRCSLAQRSRGSGLSTDAYRTHPVFLRARSRSALQESGRKAYELSASRSGIQISFSVRTTSSTPEYCEGSQRRRASCHLHARSTSVCRKPR